VENVNKQGRTFTFLGLYKKKKRFPSSHQYRWTSLEPRSLNLTHPLITTPVCREAFPQINVCTTKLQKATDSERREEGVTGFWQEAGRQTVRQTEAARKHGKERLTNCFCPLWEGAARHGLV